jgi:predicted DsbA family dithiol-disulfide isomerase
MRVVIPIYFDYASSLCYIAWRITNQLRVELPIDPLWKGVPITLRDRRVRPGREITPADREKIQSVAAETGITVDPPPHWLDSDAAVQGSELAREAGVFDAYHDAVFRAAFEERLDIGRLEVLADLAERVGMDRMRFCADIESRRMAGTVVEHRREADQFSALGYPAFMLGDFPLIGIHRVETMRLLFERFIALRTQEPGA